MSAKQSHKSSERMKILSVRPPERPCSYLSEKSKKCVLYLSPVEISDFLWEGKETAEGIVDALKAREGKEISFGELGRILLDYGEVAYNPYPGCAVECRLEDDVSAAYRLNGIMTRTIKGDAISLVEAPYADSESDEKRMLLCLGKKGDPRLMDAGFFAEITYERGAPGARGSKNQKA